MSATFTYNGYTSDNGEVMLSRFEVLPIRSPRQSRSLLIRRMHLMGIIVRDTQEELLTRIDQFITAFDIEQAGDAILSIDGTPSPHFLLNNSLTGVRIASRSWEGKPEELVRTRTYTVVLETLEVHPTSQIEEYEDTVEVIGTGGSNWRYVEMAVALPQIQFASLFTPVQIVQTGRSLGLQGYVLPTGPVIAAFEQGNHRVFAPGTPTRVGNGYLHYPLRWRYVMQTGGPTSAFPIPK